MADEIAKKEKTRNAEVDRLLTASGLTQQQAAAYLTRKLGRDFSHYHISRMASGERKVASDEMDALRDLVELPRGEAMANAGIDVALTDTGDLVPLFGFSNAAGAVLRMNEDSRIGTVPIHPAQRGSRGAYAFVTFGVSVSPRLNHGETGYAVRNKPPFKDQLCVVTKSDGEVLVKYYDHQDDKTLFIYETFPKRQPLTIPLRDVLRIDAVVGATFGPG